MAENKSLDEIFCSSCGKAIKKEAEICPHCGVRNKIHGGMQNNNASSSSRTIALLLCFFVGCLGIHRFYVGKIGTGIIYLFTLGLLDIGTFCDLLYIVTGNFRDLEHKKLTNW